MSSLQIARAMMIAGQEIY